MDANCSADRNPATRGDGFEGLFLDAATVEKFFNDLAYGDNQNSSERRLRRLDMVNAPLSMEDLNSCVVGLSEADLQAIMKVLSTPADNVANQARSRSMLPQAPMSLEQNQANNGPPAFCAMKNIAGRNDLVLQQVQAAWNPSEPSTSAFMEAPEAKKLCMSYNLTLSFRAPVEEYGTAKSLYSEELGKLYVDIRTPTAIRLMVAPPPPDNATIDISVVFTDDRYSRDPVRCCPIHVNARRMNIVAVAKVMSHMFRCASARATYFYELPGYLPTARVPYRELLESQDEAICTLTFLCYNTCSTIRRRRTMLDLRLRSNHEIIARRSVMLKMCCKPEKVMRREEREARSRRLEVDKAREAKNETA